MSTPLLFFFFNDTATTEIYTLSLHDALPISLGMTKAIPNPLLVMRLARWIRESKPDVIHTWMYHANLIGTLAARMAGNVPVVWAIHHNAFDPRVDKRRTMLVNRACALLSRKFADQIVFCSEASLR